METTKCGNAACPFVNCKEQHLVDLKRCSACQSIRYCTVPCQAADWPRHRQECSALASALAEQKAEVNQKQQKVQDAAENLSKLNITETKETLDMNDLCYRRVLAHAKCLCDNPDWTAYRNALFRMGKMFFLAQKQRCIMIIQLQKAFPADDVTSNAVQWGHALTFAGPIAFPQLQRLSMPVFNTVKDYNPLKELWVVIAWHGSKIVPLAKSNEDKKDEKNVANTDSSPAIISDAASSSSSSSKKSPAKDTKTGKGADSTPAMHPKVTYEKSTNLILYPVKICEPKRSHVKR